MDQINDRHEIFSFFTASCGFCANKFDSGDFVCSAFPKGIPDEILKGEDKHLKPLKDQGNTIVYVQDGEYSPFE
jgi:hypothetical protein